VTLPAEADQAMKRQTSSVSPDMRGRYLPVAVRRAAYIREGGQCAFVSADGRPCPARGLIEFDHVKPFAKRGSANPQNVRLLCSSQISPRANVLVPCTSAPKLPPEGAPSRGLEREDD